MNVNRNKYLGLWISIISLHALHQLEESISFFQWYVDYANKMPAWASFDLHGAKILAAHPQYFFFASVAQIVFTSFLAFLFRHNERITRILMYCYLSGLMIVFIWHIASSYVVHSYAPVMVTCIGGLYLAPILMYKLFKLNKSKL